MTRRRHFSERCWERRLLDYAYLCAEESSHDSFFDDCVAMLAADYDTIVAIIDYDRTGKVTAIYQNGLTDRALSEYKAHYYRTNVFAIAVDQAHLENATTNFERHVPRPLLHASEYYNDFLRPLRVEHALALSVRGEGQSRTSISIYRGDQNGGNFDTEDVRRLDRLRPFLKAALTIRKLAAGRGTMEELSMAGSLAEKERQLPARWGLTRRETEIALALADGLSYKEAAFKLGLSFHTVNDYVDAVHRKTGLSTARLIAVLNRRI